MYNLEKCSLIPRQMLTVTLEKILIFFHFWLDFSGVWVYTSLVIRKEEVNERKTRSASYAMTPNLSISS